MLQLNISHKNYIHHTRGKYSICGKHTPCLSPLQETRQYLIWDKEGEKDTVDHVCTQLFEAADTEEHDEELIAKARLAKGKKKGKKGKGKKATKKKGSKKRSKKKASSSSSSDSSKSSSSSSSQSDSSDDDSDSQSSQASGCLPFVVPAIMLVYFVDCLSTMLCLSAIMVLICWFPFSLAYCEGQERQEAKE